MENESNLNNRKKYKDLNAEKLIDIILNKEECIKSVIEYIKEKSDAEQWIEIPNFELTDRLEEGLK